MRLIDKLSYSQYWNIGFCEQTPVELISDRKLKHIQWLKHPYTDRWFADPFIFKITENEIVVFVEECVINRPKGIISELIIDRESMHLKKRYVLLELDTHLSYPIIYNYGEKTYVCPENGQSGNLTLYEYDSTNHRLINPQIILNEAVADATIIAHDSFYYLFATKYPKTQCDLYLYQSDSFFGPYHQIGDKTVQHHPSCSRLAGNIIKLKDSFYRPSQNCVLRYGESLSIMQGCFNKASYSELLSFCLKPKCFRYNLGIHTLNFNDNYLVVDGYGYRYPLIGRLISFLRLLKRKITLY